MAPFTARLLIVTPTLASEPAAFASDLGVTPTASAKSPSSEGVTWQPLRYFCAYRLAVSAFFAVSALTGQLLRPLGSYDFDLFLGVSVVYLLFALLALFGMAVRRPSFTAQVTSQIFVDITAATLLMHASGGIRSGLGVFVIVAVAGGGLLLSGRMAFLFAALGTLAVLAEQLRWSLLTTVSVSQFTQAGLHGIALFATAGLAFELSRRARQSAALAEKRGVELAELARLNEQIIQRMQSGALVVERDGRILLANTSAANLLGATIALGNNLRLLHADLHRFLDKWRNGERDSPDDIRLASRDIRISVGWLDRDGKRQDSAILVFLDDAAALRQQAQMLKMASLGSLTASMAHEIRNPIGAMSHAAQLLAEDPTDQVQNAHLADIINRHSARLNRIFEDVLHLGRGRELNSEAFELGEWLRRFVRDFRIARDLADNEIELSIAQPQPVRFDPDQLQQVLWNLCDNALAFARETPKLTLAASFNAQRHRPILEIYDSGPGIDEFDQNRLFEPFFTKRQGGTGLGLYVARELCVNNQAELSYQTTDDGRCCFRLVFADPRRSQAA